MGRKEVPDEVLMVVEVEQEGYLGQSQLPL
jgi:hypothetical protein